MNLVRHAFKRTQIPVLPSYTRPMKTAISLPDSTFVRVDAAAAALGISRSEVFVRAAEQYLDALDDVALTERIDAALAAAGTEGESDDSNRVAAAHSPSVFDSSDAW